MALTKKGEMTPQSSVDHSDGEGGGEEDGKKTPEKAAEETLQVFKAKVVFLKYKNKSLKN